MRVLFAGSPLAACSTLQALHDSDHIVVGVVTQPARPAGRTKLLTRTAVEVLATDLGIPVFTPESAAGLIEVVAEVQPEVAIVVAYGRLLTKEVIESIPLGWWNVHFSLLPRWRGAAPVHHAIAAGDTATGLSLFRIVPELDAGPVVVAQETPIDPHETAGMLLTRLAAMAPGHVNDFLAALELGALTEVTQTGTPTFAPKIPTGAGALDLSLDLEAVYRAFRSFTPEPGAFVVRADTKQAVKVLGAWPHPSADNLEAGFVKKDNTGVLLGTRTSPLVLRRVKPAGKAEMEAEDWFRGLPEGTRMHVGTA